MALALVLASGLAAFGAGSRWPGRLWPHLEDRIGGRNFLERGIVRDQLNLAKLARDRELKPRLLVIGSSRAQRGLDRKVLGPACRGLATLYLFDHPGMETYETRALVDELRPAPGDVVLLFWSEFDTHRGLRAQPETAPGSSPAVVELGRRLGPGVAFRERRGLLRLGLAAGLDAYRFRQVLSRAGLWSWRRFPRGDADELGTPAAQPPLLGPAPGATRELDLRAARGMVRRVLPKVGEATAATEIGQINSIAPGPHVAVQTGLLRSAAAALRRRGAEVVVVEGPLHPVAEHLYDAAVRQEFVAFARELERELGVHLLLLEDTGPFRPGHFVDLTHVNLRGSRRLVRPLRPLLRRLWAAHEAGGTPGREGRLR